jgi:hypothetical protein
MSFSTKHIGYLERDFLEDLGGRAADVPKSSDGARQDHLALCKISGISNFWEKDPEKVGGLRYLMQDLYAGLHGDGVPSIYGIVGEPSKVNLFVGTYCRQDGQDSSSQLTERLSTLQASLQSAYPGIELDSLLNEADQQLLQNLTRTFTHAALMVGTPTTKVGTEEHGVEQIERLIRGLYGTAGADANWAYIVTATPVPAKAVIQLYNLTLNELRVVANAEQSAVSESVVATKYEELLEGFLKKLALGKAQGLWHVAPCFLAQDAQTFNHGLAILKSVFSGKASWPDPVRLLACPLPKDNLHQLIYATMAAPKGPGQIQYPFKYLSLLNSEELGALTHLPMEEMPGYFVKDYARFDVACHYQETTEQDVWVGDVIDRGQKMGYPYRINCNDLTRHGLIVGTTGSGKTNTLFHLLKQLWQSQLPFMVVEPAKTEYRKLLHDSAFAQDLQVFTLGDETTSPFRLNPFEIRPGVSVQTHIDYLKSVFNASFIMYAPMPYVLERCIHEIYADKGWDMVTSDNVRGRHPKAHPTLTDLYRKIDPVVNRLGYEEKITMDVRAALKTRINSLRIGGKGLMLDTPVSTPIEILLQQPTVLELEQIGDDDEKAFLIGLLLTSLTEHYMAQGLGEGTGLSHILVVEEAHRLFQNVPSMADTEIANNKGKAVETFCNILSEIRAYGEGVLIAEQIPTKLAGDVIKNTNLKVMHRLTAADDRQVMGATMNLTGDQVKRVASFVAGEAAIYSEGDDGALAVKVPYCKLESASLDKRQENQQIRESMGRGTPDVEARLMPLTGSPQYQEQLRQYGRIARQVEDDPEFAELLARYIVSAVTYAPTLQEAFPQLVQFIYKFCKNNTDAGGVSFVLSQAIAAYFELRGQQYGWTYEEMEQIEKRFQNLVLKVALEQGLQGISERQSVESEQPSIQAFQEQHRRLCQLTVYPFAGCERVCPNKNCLYRYNVQTLLADRRLHNNFTAALADFSGDEMWRKAYEVCRVVERRVGLKSLSPEEIQKIALCFVIQKSDSMPYMDVFLKEKILTNMVGLIQQLSG